MHLYKGICASRSTSQVCVYPSCCRIVAAVFQGLLVKSCIEGWAGTSVIHFGFLCPGVLRQWCSMLGLPVAEGFCVKVLGHPWSCSSAQALLEAGSGDSMTESAIQPLLLKRCLFSIATAIVHLQKGLCKPNWRAVLLKQSQTGRNKMKASENCYYGRGEGKVF